MNRKIVYIMYAVVALVYSVTAQPLLPEIIWTQTYGGEDDDITKNCILTNDGGFAMAGQVYDNSSFNSDFYAIRTDSAGDTIWTRQYATATFDLANGIVQTSDGGFIIAGYSGQPQSSARNICLLKTDTEGDTEWLRYYSSNELNSAHCIRPTSDGCYIVSGYTGAEVFNHDALLMKIDEAGDTLWTKTYVDGDITEASCVEETSGGGFIFTGCQYTEPLFSVYLVKTDETGDTLWTRKYRRECDGNFGRSVRETSDGGYIVTGMSEWMLGWNAQVYLIRTDAEGNTIFEEFMGEIASGGSAVLQTSDNGFLVAGSYTDGSWLPDIFLLKAGSDGSHEWTEIYEEDYENYPHSFLQLPDGGFAIGGNYYDENTQSDNSLLLRLTAEGAGVGPGSSPHPAEFGLDSPYPNPFNASVTLDFTLPQAGDITISVFDVTGKTVATLFDGPHSSGTGTVTWNAENIPSGVYFARLESGGAVQTRKLLLVK